MSYPHREHLEEAAKQLFMKVFAYLYAEPLLDSPPDEAIWGQDVDRIYQDLAMATTDQGIEKRPQLQQLLRDCQTAPPTYLLVRRLEELADSLQGVNECLNQLEAFGILVIAIEQSYHSEQFQQTPPNPGQNQSETLRADLVTLLEEIQRNQRSRRIRLGHARNRMKALPPPGKAPYGYRRGKDRYVIDRATAPLVKDFFEQFLLFGSLRGAVRYLQKKYNKRISVSTGKRWLTSPIYRGDLVYQGDQVISDTHAPILSREEAAQIDRLLRRNRSLPPRTASAPRSLAGLAICQECQSPMKITRVTAPRQSREYLYLIPAACPHQPKCKAIPYGATLEQTIQTICRELPSAVAELMMPDLHGLKGAIADQIQQKQSALAQLPELVTNGVLDQETADLRTYKLRTEISAIQQRLAQLPPVNLKEIAQAVSIPQFWLDLSESERRFYFREFIRQIQLSRQDNDWRLKLIFIF